MIKTTSLKWHVIAHLKNRYITILTISYEYVVELEEDDYIPMLNTWRLNISCAQLTIFVYL